LAAVFWFLDRGLDLPSFLGLAFSQTSFIS
jgi:hypothetical protein